MNMWGFIKNNVEVMIASPFGLAIGDFGKNSGIGCFPCFLSLEFPTVYVYSDMR